MPKRFFYLCIIPGRT